MSKTKTSTKSSNHKNLTKTTKRAFCKDDQQDLTKTNPSPKQSKNKLIENKSTETNFSVGESPTDSDFSVGQSPKKLQRSPNYYFSLLKRLDFNSLLDYAVDISLELPSSKSLSNLLSQLDSREKKDTVYVRNIPRDAQISDLQNAFEKFGEIQETTIVRDPITNVSKGFGFVLFKDLLPAKTAVNASERIRINGRSLEVKFAHHEKRRSHFSKVPRRHPTQSKRYFENGYDPSFSSFRRNYRNPNERPRSFERYKLAGLVRANRSPSREGPYGSNRSRGSPSPMTRFSKRNRLQNPSKNYQHTTTFERRFPGTSDIRDYDDLYKDYVAQSRKRGAEGDESNYYKRRERFKAKIPRLEGDRKRYGYKK